MRPRLIPLLLALTLLAAWAAPAAAAPDAADQVHIRFNTYYNQGQADDFLARVRSNTEMINDPLFQSGANKQYPERSYGFGYNNRGAAFFKLGLLDLAVKDYVRGIPYQPSWWRAGLYALAAQLRLTLGDCQEAAELLEKGFASEIRDPKDLARLRRLRAALHMNCGGYRPILLAVFLRNKGIWGHLTGPDGKRYPFHSDGGYVLVYLPWAQSYPMHLRIKDMPVSISGTLVPGRSRMFIVDKLQGLVSVWPAERNMPGQRRYSHQEEEANPQAFARQSNQLVIDKLNRLIDSGWFAAEPGVLDDLIFTRANYCLTVGNYDQARADLLRYLQKNPDSGAAHHNLGVCWSRAKRYDQAIAEYDKAIQLKASELWRAYQNRGWCHQRLKRLDQALADYSRAIELNPQEAWLWKARSRVYIKTGDKAKAIADLEEYLLRLPGDATAAKALAALRKGAKAKSK